jgi:transglutaminase-like putative cysteine protease
MVSTAIAGQGPLVRERTFEVSVRVDVIESPGPTRVWLPLPLTRATPYQRSIAQTWTASTQDVERRQDGPGPAMLVATWPETATARALTLTMRVATSDRRVIATGTPGAVPESRDSLAPYLRPTALIPTDGIVRDTAVGIVKGRRTPMAQAQAIYDWIVEHTFRDPEIKGCGLGDIRWMLESGSLGGKCADLNALFVGLCRAVGLPARDLYGIRVGESREFRSLGRTGGDMTTAQHCRAEVYIDGVGWMPADPADVRKVMLEEQPDSTETSAHARRARDLLFGHWEMNWIAFNDAHDVDLPGSSGKRLPFLMYPQAEVDGARRDSLDPARFQYQITARE